MFYGTNVLPDCKNIDFSSSIVVQSGGLYGLFAGTKVTDSDLRSILSINPDTGNYWLPATTLKRECYYGMFQDCTGLSTAPELPATTLTDKCYQRMFYGCSNLNYIKAMFTTTPGSSYTTDWVSGVASTGTFVKNAAATWNVTGVNGVPSGWTITRETQGGVKIIEFTIDNTSYQAEEGMTWGEWVNSEYNTIGVYINDYNVVYWSRGFYITDDGLNIYSSEIIENNKGYYKREETGGI